MDFSGALLLVTAVSVQHVGLSLGGNELPWSSPWVIGALLGSLALFALFIRVEKRTKAIPLIPLRMLNSRLPILIQVSNVCAGASAFAVSDSYKMHFSCMPGTNIKEILTSASSSCSYFRCSSKSYCSTRPPRPECGS